MVRDTRRRVAVERAERASIVWSAHDAIIGMTRSGVVSSCNPAAARLYRYTARELVGQPAEALVAPERRVHEATVLRRILAGEVVDGYSAERICGDGSVVTVSLTISPILDPAGAIVGAATVSRRVNSELRDAQDRFEVHVDQHRAETQDAQDRFEVRIGKERVEARDAQERFEVHVGQHRAEVQDAQERFEVRVDQERGEAQDAQDRFEVLVELERKEAEIAQGQFQIRMDAERADTQSNSDRLQAYLEQSQRLEALGQLAGGVAHDFNNLLSVILNYAAFVAEEIASGHRCDWVAAGRDVGQIQRAAQRATGLTHQLLAFARREVVQPQVLDLNDVVTDVEHLLDRTIGEDVVLHTKLAADLWPVLADPGQIEQVIVNLAVNARDAMSGGTLVIDTANITVGTDYVAAGAPVRPGRHVRLRVSDTGCGMPADVVEHVFEPFFTTKPDGLGTGLGLATVYGIVTQAGATIKIHSLPGVGTTFTLMFPVTDEIAVVPSGEAAPYQRTPSGETLLLVEDEEAIRDVTERILTRAGYRVIAATGGLDAVALAGGHDGEIQLLITDVVMPAMPGPEVAERVCRIRPGVEVLYMSGYARSVLASRGKLAPDANLIEKPFSAAALVEKVGQLLSGELRGSAPP
jgi:PAS domain S-box-containing protein